MPIVAVETDRRTRTESAVGHRLTAKGTARSPRLQEEAVVAVRADSPRRAQGTASECTPTGETRTRRKEEACVAVETLRGKGAVADLTVGVRTAETGATRKEVSYLAFDAGRRVTEKTVRVEDRTGRAAHSIQVKARIALETHRVVASETVGVRTEGAGRVCQQIVTPLTTVTLRSRQTEGTSREIGRTGRALSRRKVKSAFTDQTRRRIGALETAVDGSKTGRTDRT